MSSALSVRNVSKQYGTTRVLHDVTFECPRGAIVAFVGPNGAGKSTTLRIVCRLTTADSGDVLTSSDSRSSEDRAGLLVGSVLDPSAHHPGRTVWTTVRLPALMLGVPDERVSALLTQLGLGEVQRRRFGQLSLGMKQRVALTIALLASPSILVLDEPMNGLDVDGIDWLRTFLQSFAANGGTVLVSSHLLNELQTFADRVVIISKGRIVADQAVRGHSSGSEVEADDPSALEALLVQEGIGYTRDSATFAVATTRDAIARLAFDHQVLLLGIKEVSTNSNIEQTYHRLAEGEYVMKQAEESNDA